MRLIRSFSLVFASLSLISPALAQVAPVTHRQIDVLTFDQPPAGLQPTELFGRHGTGPVGVAGTNPLLPGQNAALIFDSANPTGGDLDLGTPNEDFGGPGVGIGGELGSPFVNRRHQGGVLVVADDLTDADGDGLVDDPGDFGDAGGSITLDFTAVGPVVPIEIDVLDVESSTVPSTLELIGVDGSVLATIDIPVVGDNGTTRVSLPRVGDVMVMQFDWGGSAAIDRVLFETNSASIASGFVWMDDNLDGLRDAGEPGLANVILDLFPDGALSGPPIETVSSEDDGSFRFSAVPPGPYVIVVDEATLPPDLEASPCNVGSDDTVDSDCSPLPVLLQPYSGSSNLGFGYGPGCDLSIGDLVFLDLNGDHVQDPGDVGLANITLRLYTEDGTLIETQISGPNGEYLFDGLCAGTYLLAPDTSTYLGGLLGPSICNVGTDSTIDSECGPVCVQLVQTLPGALPVGNVTIDFGFASCVDGSCSGKVDALSLLYTGTEPAFIEVIQSQGEVPFAGMVSPGGTFSFFGLDNQLTLGPDINLFVEGIFDSNLHTSCSQPVFVGLTFGSFEIVAGTSRNGGPFCVP